MYRYRCHHVFGRLRSRTDKAYTEKIITWACSAPKPTSQARVFIPPRTTAKTLVAAGHVGLQEFIA